jgi:hypothetical protein
MTVESSDPASARFIRCPCGNKLGQRLRDGAIVQIHAGRRTVFERLREITCGRCRLTVVFPPA